MLCHFKSPFYAEDKAVRCTVTWVLKKNRKMFSFQSFLSLEISFDCFIHLPPPPPREPAAGGWDRWVSHTHTLRCLVSGFGTQATQQDLRVHLVHWSSHVIGWGFRPCLLVWVRHSWLAAESRSGSGGFGSVGCGRRFVYRPGGLKLLHLSQQKKSCQHLVSVSVNEVQEF